MSNTWIHLHFVIHCFNVCRKGNSVVTKPHYHSYQTIQKIRTNALFKLLPLYSTAASKTIRNFSIRKIVLKDGAVDTMCFLRLSMLLICKFSLHNPFRCKYRCCLYISFSNLDLPAYWTSWVVHCYSLGMMFFLLAITQELYILLPYILSLNQDVTKSSYHPGTFHICLKLWLFLSPFAKSFLDCYSSLLHFKLTHSSQISG